MNTPIRIVIKGLGTVGKQFSTEALKRGVQVVGAVDGWDRLHGTDLGSHLGEDELGVTIEADIGAVLRRTEPDVLVLANATSVADIAPDLRAAVEHGVDVITSAEHAFFWKRVEPEVGRQLDAEAAAAGVTILGTGIQDVFWAVLPAALTAASHSIDSIAGSSLGLMDPYGPVVMDEARIGWTVEEFRAATTGNDAGQHLDPGAIALYALVHKLGLTITDERTRVEPVTSEKDLFARGLDRTVPAGQLIGNAAVLELSTAEGIGLSSTFTARLAEYEGETETVRWDISGHPNLSMSVEDFHGDITTTSGMINRLGDVIAAQPGFITVNDLPVPSFQGKALGHSTGPAPASTPLSNPTQEAS